MVGVVYVGLGVVVSVVGMDKVLVCVVFCDVGLFLVRDVVIF